MEKYTVQQVAELFKVSDRAIVKRCNKAKIKMRNGKYLIPADILETWTEAREKRNRNTATDRTKNIVPITVPKQVPIAVPSDAEKKMYQEQIKNLEDEARKLKEDMKLLNATLRFAVDGIRDLQGKENMTTTIQKMNDATKLEVVTTDEMMEKIKAERKDNKKLQKEPIMNSIHFSSSYNKNWNKDYEQ